MPHGPGYKNRRITHIDINETKQETPGVESHQTRGHNRRIT